MGFHLSRREMLIKRRKPDSVPGHGDGVAVGPPDDWSWSGLAHVSSRQQLNHSIGECIVRAIPLELKPKRRIVRTIGGPVSCLQNGFSIEHQVNGDHVVKQKKPVYLGDLICGRKIEGA
jgi:hypothetical protein